MTVSSQLDTVVRDIDCVIITGAGASREFGATGQPMPLMNDWSKHLVRALIKGGYYLELSGLRQAMIGPEFEAQLGEFFRQRNAFRAIKPLLLPSVKLPNVPPNFQAVGEMDAWHQAASVALDEILKIVNQSLYELFAEPYTNIERATEEFGWLLGVLGITATTPFVFATTNYDIIATRVVERLGFLPDWGPPPVTSPGGSEQDLRVEGLLNGMPRFVPILHLHGRVGWYERPSGHLVETSGTKYSHEFGTPLVMLPDRNKDYGSIGLINSIWEQFRIALGRAKRVFVLGHSLNDEELCLAIRDYVTPQNRIAVTTYATGNQPPTSLIEGSVARYFPGASVIPMNFGNEKIGEQEIQSWIGTSESN